MILTLSRLARRAVGIAGTALLVTLVGFSVFTHLAPLSGRELFIIIGGSMEPAIPIGSLVVTAPTDPATVVAGDVLTIRGDSGVAVTHRVRSVVDTPTGRRFEMKGDANESPDDGLVPADAVVGAADVYVPYAGYARAFLSTGPGLVVTLSTLGTLFLTYLLLTLLAPKDGVSPPKRTEPIRP
jgi:signal peptidase